MSKSSAAAVLPRDARLIALLLAANGAEDCEEGVIRMLVEFAHRYTTDVLTDSLVYAEHARSGTANSNASNLVPSLDDVRLAIQARADGSSVPKEFLLQLATSVNSIPLPAVPEVYGIRLPPPASRLTAPNFSLVPRSNRPEQHKRESSNIESEQGSGLFGDEGEDDEDEEDDDDDEEMEDVIPSVGGGLSALGTQFDKKRKAEEDPDEGGDDEYD